MSRSICSRHMQILIVSPTKDSANPLQATLLVNGFRVESTQDRQRNQSQYDLIILDTSPETGLQICTQVRESGGVAPILVLNERFDIAAKAEFLNAGADDCLAKPFATEELLARIRALLRRPLCIEEEVFEISNLTVNTRTHRVTLGSTPVHLARKEFMVLAYLLRNRGSVVTRDMLLENVWSQEVDPSSNTVSAHVRSLRRKLANGTKPLIRTIAGDSSSWCCGND